MRQIGGPIAHFECSAQTQREYVGNRWPGRSQFREAATPRSCGLLPDCGKVDTTSDYEDAATSVVVRFRRRSRISIATASPTNPTATYSKLRTRAAAIAKPVPSNASVPYAAGLPPEKTCLPIVSPRRAMEIAPITSAATSTPCQASVIGMSKTAWAIIGGIKDRVQQTLFRTRSRIGGGPRSYRHCTHLESDTACGQT